MDWAMKWLPMKYWEAQRDFFAKRGLPWHVTYVIRVQQAASSSTASVPSSSLPAKRLFQHRTFLHLFDQCTQNSRSVTSILADVFKRLKAQDPNIKYAYLRADNAGCFHGSETLLSIKQLFDQTGVFIRRIDFSDPQSGKSACDRMAAVVKCTVRRHINEKNNVENSKQFVDAAKTTKHLSAFASRIVPHPTSTTSAKSSKKIDWPGVSTFNNIQYEIKSSSSDLNQLSKKTLSHLSNEIEITAWRSYNLGIGKKFKWSDLNTVKNLDQLVVMYEAPPMNSIWMDESSKADNSDASTSESDLEDEDKDDHDEIAQQANLSLTMFDCPASKCIRQFRREKNLRIHLAIGRHKYPPNQLTLLDKAKLSYRDQLENVKFQQTPSLQNFIVIHNTKTSSNDLLKQGWALFQRGINVPFSPMQVAFLTQKYGDGEKNGLKWDPSAVEEEMHNAMENGKYLFEPSQCLSSSQIKSYFGRLTRKRRQQSQTSSFVQRHQEKNDANTEDENDQEDDQDSLNHVQLMQQSITILSQKQKSELSTSSPSTTRKMDSRSIDDLNKEYRVKRTSIKKH